MPRVPTVHLICGATGAGKTTYAMALADRAGAVRFSIDEWMGNLFVVDEPEPPERAWGLDRTARCEVQMWAIADQVLVRGVDVVFDVGLTTLEHRDRFRTRVAHTRAQQKLHYLDVDRETRLARILARNAKRTGTYISEVTEAMFHVMESQFEPPMDDELYGGMIVCEG